jgi:hypothetical protein
MEFRNLLIMNMHILKILLVVFCLNYLNQAKAQHSINTTGGDVSGTGGTIAYTIGQVSYLSVSDTSGSISEGIQQTYLISQVGLKESGYKISVSVYPNPSDNFITLQVENLSSKSLHYQVCDLQGKSILQGTVLTDKTPIHLEEMSAATYYLSIIDELNNLIQTFKIIKR